MPRRKIPRSHSPRPCNDAAPAKKIDTASQETTGKSLDCKKFFPSVGMTLSVPCE